MVQIQRIRDSGRKRHGHKGRWGDNETCQDAWSHRKPRSKNDRGDRAQVPSEGYSGGQSMEGGDKEKGSNPTPVTEVQKNCERGGWITGREKKRKGKNEKAHVGGWPKKDDFNVGGGNAEPIGGDELGSIPRNLPQAFPTWPGKRRPRNSSGGTEDE